MSDTHSRTNEHLAWLSYPLLLFAASRGLIFAFTGSAPFFGGNLGPPTLFAHEHSFWATFAHGDLSRLAQLARDGYQRVADTSYFPLVPWLGKGLGAVFGSMEGALIVLSLLACAAAFVGVYRLFAALGGRDTARWGVALLAAFPFSYHLSDGSALACGLALSVWGVVLALRGSSILASTVLALAVLAHPASILSAMAVLCLPEGSWWRRGVALLIPCGALMSWTLYLRSHLGVSTAALWSAWWSGAAPPHSAWPAILAALGSLALCGVLLLGRRPRLRRLMLPGVLALGAFGYSWSPSSAPALALAWPAFLGLAALLAERQVLRAPLVAILGAQQGLLLYCYTHFLPLT